MLVQHLDWSSVPYGGDLSMELATSRDGKEWKRDFRSSMGYPKFLPVNPMSGMFDSGTLWTNARFIPTKDGKRQRLWYGAYCAWGTDCKGKIDCDCKDDATQSGIGLATMRTNGFAYLTPQNVTYPAQVTMKAVSLEGVCGFSVNVDVSDESASLKLELLSHTGYVIDGYSQAKAISLQQVSDTDVPVTWDTEHARFPQGYKGEIIIRAHFLGAAKLYAINLMEKC